MHQVNPEEGEHTAWGSSLGNRCVSYHLIFTLFLNSPFKGTGFGSLSILAAQTVDCTITTVTLSVHQSELARSRIASAGLQDRITVYNMDFRECIQYPEWAGSFDRFISIEMIENIGKDFIAEYWRVVDWALKKTSAIGVAQVISMPEART